MLIGTGTVISEPPASQKPFPNSEYDHTSILSTARKILGIDLPPLTNRDAWAATFEHVLDLPSPRTDCPMHLPPAPPRAPPSSFSETLSSEELSLHEEGQRPVNSLQKEIMSVLAHFSGVQFPHHVKKQVREKVTVYFFSG